MYLTENDKFVGFNNNQKFKFIKLSFNNTYEANRLKIKINNTPKFRPYKGWTLTNKLLYETNIPPFFRFIHENNICRNICI